RVIEVDVEKVVRRRTARPDPPLRCIVEALLDLHADLEERGPPWVIPHEPVDVEGAGGGGGAILRRHADSEPRQIAYPSRKRHSVDIALVRHLSSRVHNVTECGGRRRSTATETSETTKSGGGYARH